MGANTYGYEYDPIGNRITVGVSGELSTYSANALNQYTSISNGQSAISNPTYDPDGNMLTNGVWSYTWDAENRLASAVSNNVLVVTNVYDHMSRRILKAVSAYNASTGNYEPVTRNLFLYDGWNVISETIHHSHFIISTSGASTFPALCKARAVSAGCWRSPATVRRISPPTTRMKM